MNTIEAFEKDILLQTEFLKKFQKQKPLHPNIQKNILFSGSGDSLVSAMLAESFSDGTVTAIDPLDLFKNKNLAKSKHVYFVSISGNTITNVKVAKIAKKSVAITSKPQSRLANASDQTILLSAPNNDVFTAGSISFLESALTCISLVKKITIPRNNSKIFHDAKKNARDSKISKRVFVLGNQFTYLLAMYCAAKIYEVLGYDAHYVKIEQFSHMELFSVKKGDTVIIFEEENSHNKLLAESLRKININVIHPTGNIPKKKISQILYFVFFSQLLSLYEAKRKKKRDCYFVTAKKIRNISNQMIY